MSSEDNKNKKMKDAIAAIAPEALLADGFDNALVGIARQFTKIVALYDYSTCVKILMKRDGMTQGDAIEFMEYNVLGAWVGENTPAFVVGSQHLANYDAQRD